MGHCDPESVMSEGPVAGVHCRSDWIPACLMKVKTNGGAFQWTGLDEFHIRIQALGGVCEGSFEFPHSVVPDFSWLSTGKQGGQRNIMYFYTLYISAILCGL